MAKSPFYKSGPAYLTDPEEKEKLISKKVTTSREISPEGIPGRRVTVTSQYRTPGGTIPGSVPRTPEGDKAYAALTPEQRKKQDESYKAKNRQEVSSRFVPDALKIPQSKINLPKQTITAPDVNKLIYSDVFNTKTENPNYELRKKLYETKSSKRRQDYRLGEITKDENRALYQTERSMQKLMFSPEEIKEQKQKRKIRKIKKAITSVIPKDNRTSYEKKLGRKRKTRGSGNPCKSCN